MKCFVLLSSANVIPLEWCCSEWDILFILCNKYVSIKNECAYFEQHVQDCWKKHTPAVKQNLNGKLLIRIKIYLLCFCCFPFQWGCVLLRVSRWSVWFVVFRVAKLNFVVSYLRFKLNLIIICYLYLISMAIIKTILGR